MDFLTPPHRSNHLVMLLLLVAQRGGTFILLYSWDSRAGLGKARPNRCSGQKLPLEDSLPLMLIPSRQWASFIIVTETHIVVYDDILSNEAKRISLLLPDQNPLRYENSTRSPLWVQWTKPPRHAAYNKTHDDIYLLREDGVMRYYIVDHTSPTRIDGHFEPGHLGINIDTAIASLEGNPTQEGGDVLIVGGDMTDGGVYSIRAKNRPVCIQLIPNLAPTCDILVINSHDHRRSKALRDPDRDERIFVCSGRGTGHTAISEIRFGLEAQIGLTADYQDLASVSRVWPLSDNARERIVFLISHAQHTTAMCLDVPALELELADSETCPGIDLSMPTLAAATSSMGFIIQITERDINTTNFSADTPATSTSHSFPKALVAAVHGGLGLVVIGFENSTGFGLHICVVRQNDNTFEINASGPIFQSQHEPTVLHLTDIGSSALLFIGSASGTLQIISIDQSHGHKLILERTLIEVAQILEPCAISDLVVLNRPSRSDSYLLCGFRNGLLLCMKLIFHENSKDISLGKSRVPRFNSHFLFPN